MGKEFLTFGDVEIETKYHHKSPVCLMVMDIEEVLISNKISFGEKTISIW